MTDQDGTGPTTPDDTTFPDDTPSTTPHGPSTGSDRPAAGSFREDQGAADDAVIAAVGRASEGFEYVERARGHLYAFHQLMGRADLLLGEAADALTEAGEPEAAGSVDREAVGRNVLDGRWTFQVVEEFDALYYEPVRAVLRELEARFQGGRRHVFEARMKEERRSSGRAGHEHRPAAAHDGRVETDPSGAV